MFANKKKQKRGVKQIKDCEKIIQNDKKQQKTIFEKNKRKQ